MKQVFMLDIETTGLDKKRDEVLEISILQCEWDDGYYVPSNKFDIFIPSSRTPQNDFAKEKMQWLYRYCNSLAEAGEVKYPSYYRSKILEFLSFCGATSRMNRVFQGWNVVGFDLTFLREHGFLDEMDYNYRVYEMSGLVMGMLDSLQFSGDNIARSRMLEYICDQDPTNLVLPTTEDFPIDLVDPPDNLEHWGMYDCYSQLKCLNGGLRLMRKGFDNVKVVI